MLPAASAFLSVSCILCASWEMVSLLSLSSTMRGVRLQRVHFIVGEFDGSTWINITAHMRDRFQDGVSRRTSKERSLHVTLHSLMEGSCIFVVHNLLVQLPLRSDRCSVTDSTLMRSIRIRAKALE